MKTLHNILQPVLNDIRAGQKTNEISELWGASKALFLFGLQHETRQPVVIVTATEEDAETLAEDLRFFLGKKNLFTTDAGSETRMEPLPESSFPQGAPIDQKFPSSLPGACFPLRRTHLTAALWASACAFCISWSPAYREFTSCRLSP